ncbi:MULTISPECIES: urease accessory protein UreF [Clostridium]|uniref:Urease accessory protein UreF n=2 Tax=Clostridium TaxID=1485 RepID=A0A1S9N5U0_CLOBE|nr:MULTISPECIES: urease accessory protein UreF [Clostridium]EKQ54857.1 MAG: urease accessory protein UreF [Clostridium sp. Maddingley MBC34-26]MZK51548.1 urease accessory protein UreF [Clostridium beijerinckii]MZK59823.1 urease accessory protein UreF [Clostridium beijerinckii]MZK70108.1 urease accessory protein UreF [Clostridium beijerinckii]MZK75351.1 urease accessory protein UreF [Clostridium beijerinckii]
MDSRKTFILLQINDGLFPIGAYSHSYGIETYVQKNIICDAETAFRYIENNIKYNFLYTELLAVKLAFEYAQSNDLEKLSELDEIIIASKTPLEIRNASLKLSSRFIKTLNNITVEYESDIFNKYSSSSTVKNMTQTYAVSYGVFCAAVGIDKGMALEAFLYSQTSACITNCVKLVPLSQTQGQQLLYRSYCIFEEILSQLENLTIEKLCLSTPGFDIRCMQHESLYSRLYMS